MPFPAHIVTGSKRVEALLSDLRSDLTNRKLSSQSRFDYDFKLVCILIGQNNNRSWSSSKCWVGTRIIQLPYSPKT